MNCQGWEGSRIRSIFRISFVIVGDSWCILNIRCLLLYIYMVLIVNFPFWRTSQDTYDFGAISETMLIWGMWLAAGTSSSKFFWGLLHHLSDDPPAQSQSYPSWEIIWVLCTLCTIMAHIVGHICSTAYKTNHNPISSYRTQEPSFQSPLPTLHSSCSTLHVPLNTAQLVSPHVGAPFVGLRTDLEHVGPKNSVCVLRGC
jgi:hypothetical protein